MKLCGEQPRRSVQTRVRDTSISAVWRQVTASQAWGQLARPSSVLGTCRDGVRTHAGSGVTVTGEEAAGFQVMGLGGRAGAEGGRGGSQGLFLGLRACSC